jgi:hypothetical protein
MATVDGSLIALTTPFGQRGWFYEAWTEGGEDWTRVRVSADQCPRLSAAFLAGELKALGPQTFKQEYQLEFVSDSEAIFPIELVARAFTHEVQSIW